MTGSPAPCPPPLLSWLAMGVDGEASDVHLVTGHPPVLRVHGRLNPLDAPPLEAELLASWLLPLLPPHAAASFSERHSADFACEWEVHGNPRRFRANFFRTRGEMAACFRIIPDSIPDFEWAGFPRALAQRLTRIRNGLVLITGVVGSGKTTTLAMLVDMLNRQAGFRILTIEEPVEYLFEKVPGSLVTQREVGTDVLDFADGLRAGLRQDPDVILLGEIRDRETAQIALSAAETGHLVFSTLHTRDAKGAISRYADLFPQAVQGEIRGQLALSLRAVVSQHLLPSTCADGKRELALEILLNTAPVASAVRFGKLESIDNAILTGKSDGMQTLDDAVRQLLQAGAITRETAAHYVSDPRYLR